MKLLTAALISAILVLSGCTGCSKSGRINKGSQGEASFDGRKPSANIEEKTAEKRPLVKEHTVIKMQKYNGVYTIPVTVNGVAMSFIFDTGASLISISKTEAGFLFKQGKLDEEDFVGTSNFIDANGDVSEGAVILLKEVQIGNKVLHNVQASVVDNLTAPLLFGQSALEKFGKISIDYAKEEITFEQ